MTTQELTWDKLKDDFTAHLKSKGKSISTLLGYGKDVDQLIVFVKSLNKNLVHEVKQEDLKKFFEN